MTTPCTILDVRLSNYPGDSLYTPIVGNKVAFFSLSPVHYNYNVVSQTNPSEHDQVCVNAQELMDNYIEMQGPVYLDKHAYNYLLTIMEFVADKCGNSTVNDTFNNLEGRHVVETRCEAAAACPFSADDDAYNMHEWFFPTSEVFSSSAP